MNKIKSLDFANFLLFNSKKDLSNLELQVLMNLICMDFKNKYSNELLLDALINFKAYPFKISEEVYWEFRNYGASSIDRPEKEIQLNLSKEKIKFILEKINFYIKNNYYENIKLLKGLK